QRRRAKLSKQLCDEAQCPRPGTLHSSHPRQASSGFRNGRVWCRRQASFEVADQNHVARLRAAREGELLAVAREVEPEDLVGLEVGQLYRLATVQWQRPDVGDAVNGVYVC